MRALSGRFVVGRVLQVAPTAAAIVVIGFVLIHLAPGDPVLALAGESGDAAYYDFMRHRFGLDQSLPHQLARYAGRVLSGDLGSSHVYGRGTMSLIMERAPATLLLTTTALLLSLLVALPIGAAAALRPHGARDVGISAFALALHSTPTFWVAQVAVLGLAVHGGIFPVQGMTSAGSMASGWNHAWDIVRHLALPAVALASQEIAVFVRVTRNALIDELPRDHIRTARAKGLSAVAALTRHAMPRVLLPLVTIVGARVGHLIAGAAVVEIVFGWPGMGRLLLASLQSRDAPILLGLFLVVSIAVVLANLLADIVHAAIDPRAR